MQLVSVVAIVFAAAMLISLPQVDADIIAWSGNACTGDEGDNVACDNSCHSFDGRHSFEVYTSPCSFIFPPVEVSACRSLRVVHTVSHSTRTMVAVVNTSFFLGKEIRNVSMSTRGRLLDLSVALQTTYVT